MNLIAERYLTSIPFPVKLIKESNRIGRAYHRRLDCTQLMLERCLDPAITRACIANESILAAKLRATLHRPSYKRLHHRFQRQQMPPAHPFTPVALKTIWSRPSILIQWLQWEGFRKDQWMAPAGQILAHAGIEANVAQLPGSPGRIQI